MTRIRIILAAFAMLAVALLGWVLLAVSRPPAGTPIRIGVNYSPPLALLGTDGAPYGFSIEVLNEAARRSGIKLEWVVCPEGPDRALKSGKVDVWHILTDLPDRRKWAFYTDPWLRTKYFLTVRSESGIHSLNDAVDQRVSHTDDLLQVRLARQFFPRSTLVPEAVGTELGALCRGDAEGSFIDQKQLVNSLLYRPRECESIPLDVIPIEDAAYQMGIGATNAGALFARELRSEITNMAQDRTLDRLQRRWLKDTGDETRIVIDLAQARQRSSLFRYSAVILAALALLLAVLMYRERTVRVAVKSAYEFASAVLDTAGGLVYIADRHGRIVRFNRACERATGKTSQEVRNKTSWDAFVPPEERAPVQAMFVQLASGMAHATHEHHWQTREGRRLFSWSNTVLLNKAGRVDYIIATGIDISHREAAEQKLGYEATHDSLTNLMNRRQFCRELDIACSTAKTGGPVFKVVFADLDHFKIINDTHGHEAGDDVLVYVSRLLRSELGPHDTAARLGGDEFCIIMRSPDPEIILERIKTHLMDHEFHSLTGKPFHAAVTFGLVSSCDTFHNPADLLRAADQALYLAKRRGPIRLPVLESARLSA